VLCLILNVGGIGSSYSKIPVELISSAQGTLLTSECLADITLFEKFYSVTKAFHCEADADKTSIILAFSVFSKQFSYSFHYIKR